MSDRKARLTITVDPHLSAYAEHLVETGKAPSVSAPPYVLDLSVAVAVARFDAPG
jgi:hypothetical protein